ncbi:MAG TPA: beta-galactosidase GalB [Candidatus Acidoferrales bacterium]|nr:beta-galactosidase GalB [Candidatus Acidoferrales bacterium]
MAGYSLYGAGPGLASSREKISIDDGWRFIKGDPTNCAVSLLYDIRRTQALHRFDAEADGNPALGQSSTLAESTNPTAVIKQWILPTGNEFIKDPSQRFVRPDGNLGNGVAYVLPDFDDRSWQRVNLPHDWAIAGPFTHSGGGGMGRLPTAGVGWYRKQLDIPAADTGKMIYLDVDGAMSYAVVWLNGRLVGGWPYGYASWRVDLTPYVNPGGTNELAIRLDNPPDSSRWYPGAGIYRNVWLVKTAPVHVGHWGTYITTPMVSSSSATVDLKVTVDNDLKQDAKVSVSTLIFPLNADGEQTGAAVAEMATLTLSIPAGSSAVAAGATTVADPKLWGPPPQQHPNRYVAITTLKQGDKVVDVYETPFGIRAIRFDPSEGFFINGEHIPLNGVCDHHDLGALGAAVNYRALQRQLEMLSDMGCNAIRTSHNPPAPELLELADNMGFLVMDEMFDCWQRDKTPNDYHLLFDDWHEPDLRAQIRRDRNSPSVIMWSIGNEVGEQFTGTNGAALARQLCHLVHDEDPTRPTTSAMNWSRPTDPLPRVLDIIGLNYQGAGIRGASGKYPAFHQQFPDKFIFGSETADAMSSRGVYVFPVTTNNSAAVGPNSGEDRMHHQVSAYELYAAPFGSSADKVFASQEKNPYVGGEFVWTGWDYLGEPTPFDSSRSSYSGIMDLAGFKKDRFYLYQAHWRPDYPMAHILPHWTWPERIGQVTPVHVFTSGDEGELFLNGKSLGRKAKGPYEYRLRWDDVVYEPGTLKVVAYKDGKVWATDEVKTAGAPAALKLAPDRSTIGADGKDLSFITVTVTDLHGLMAPRADNRIHFQIAGPGEIVATDNGDPTDFESFPSHDRQAFNGLCLVIIRGRPGQPGTIHLTAKADGLKLGTVSIKMIPATHSRPGM